MSQGLILLDALPSVFWKKTKKERNGRNGQGAFSQGRHALFIGCAMLCFSHLLGAIKSCSNSPSILCVPNMLLLVVILARNNQNYPSVGPIY
jgi:hypothetical protein